MNLDLNYQFVYLNSLKMRLQIKLQINLQKQYYI